MEMGTNSNSNHTILWLVGIAIILVIALLIFGIKTARADDSLISRMGNKLKGGLENTVALKPLSHLIDDPVAAKKACENGFVGQTEAVAKGIVDGAVNGIADLTRGVYDVTTFILPCPAIDEMVYQSLLGPVKDGEGGLTGKRKGGLQGAIKAVAKGVLIDSWMHPHKTFFGTKTVLGLEDISDRKLSKDGILPGAWHILTAPSHLLKINQ